MIKVHQDPTAMISKHYCQAETRAEVHRCQRSDEGFISLRDFTTAIVRQPTFGVLNKGIQQFPLSLGFR